MLWFVFERYTFWILIEVLRFMSVSWGRKILNFLKQVQTFTCSPFIVLFPLYHCYISSAIETESLNNLTINQSPCDPLILNHNSIILWQKTMCWTQLTVLAGENPNQTPVTLRFEVVMVVKMSLFFWVVMPCGLTGRYHHFGVTYALHLHQLMHIVIQL